MQSKINTVLTKTQHFMDELKDRGQVFFQPSNQFELFETFHNIMTRLAITEHEDDELGKHPSDVQNDLNVMLINIVFLADDIPASPASLTYYNSHHLYDIYLEEPYEGDLTIFYPTIKQCEAFLFELFYNKLLLTF